MHTNQRRSKARRLISALAPLALALLAPGCVDKEKCDEAIRVTRDALAKEQPDLARQWRDRAWKLCEDATTTGALDKEILDKEAALAKRVADQAAQVAQAAQQRMKTAGSVWRGFDGLPEEQRTVARLDAHRDKAGRMTQGLPPEYARQIEAYNAREYDRRRKAVDAAAKKP